MTAIFIDLEELNTYLQEAFENWGFKDSNELFVASTILFAMVKKGNLFFVEDDDKDRTPCTVKFNLQEADVFNKTIN